MTDEESPPKRRRMQLPVSRDCSRRDGDDSTDKDAMSGPKYKSRRDSSPSRFRGDRYRPRRDDNHYHRAPERYERSRASISPSQGAYFHAHGSSESNRFRKDRVAEEHPLRRPPEQMQYPGSRRPSFEEKQETIRMADRKRSDASSSGRMGWRREARAASPIRDGRRPILPRSPEIYEVETSKRRAGRERRRDTSSDEESRSSARGVREKALRREASKDAESDERSCSCSCRYCSKAHDVERRLKELYSNYDTGKHRNEVIGRTDKKRKRTSVKSESDFESDASGLEANRRGAVGDRYGKYGIIGESHRFTKRAEFQAWIAEVKKLDYEGLSQISLKTLWSEFVEDYNTATFPSKKYYDMGIWDAKHSAKTGDPTGGPWTLNFDDEETRRRETKQIREREKERLMGEAYNVLRNDSEIVEAMKRQKELKTQMDYLFKTGKVDRAREIQSLLRVEDTRNREKQSSAEIPSLEED